MDILVSLMKVSPLIALIIASSWIIVEKSFNEGIMFFILGFGFVFVFWFFERGWIEHKHSRGIKE